MQTKDCHNPEISTKYLSVTFSEYAKILSNTNKNEIFNHYEVERINRKFSIKNRQFEKKGGDVVKARHISKKKKKIIKMKNKFILLKKNSNRPDKVRVYDTRSNFSFTLINIKDTQKAVDVPSLWKTRKKFLLGHKGNEHNDLFLKHYSNIKNKIKKGFGNFKSVIQIANENVLFKNYLKFGEYFYEGKNLEKNLEKYQPGTLSNNLRNALGISLYSNPPWLLNFKKFGLPPSYFSYASLTSTSNIFFKNRIHNIQIYYNLKTFTYWGES